MSYHGDVQPIIPPRPSNTHLALSLLNLLARPGAPLHLSHPCRARAVDPRGEEDVGAEVRAAVSLGEGTGEMGLPFRWEGVRWAAGDGEKCGKQGKGAHDACVDGGRRMLRSRGTGSVRVVYIFLGVNWIGLVVGRFRRSWVEVVKHRLDLVRILSYPTPFQRPRFEEPTLNTGEGCPTHHELESEAVPYPASY